MAVCLSARLSMGHDWLNRNVLVMAFGVQGFFNSRQITDCFLVACLRTTFKRSIAPELTAVDTTCSQSTPRLDHHGTFQDVDVIRHLNGRSFARDHLVSGLTERFERCPKCPDVFIIGHALDIRHQAFKADFHTAQRYVVLVSVIVIDGLEANPGIGVGCGGCFTTDRTP
ncbi:hypothetical protein D3C86_1647490 [compost metagenome]